MSWKPEVVAELNGTWVGNATRFATKGEAEDYVEDLRWRWTSVRLTRVVEVDDPVNYVWHAAEGRAAPLPAQPKTQTGGAGFDR